MANEIEHGFLFIMAIWTFFLRWLLKHYAHFFINRNCIAHLFSYLKTYIALKPSVIHLKSCVWYKFRMKIHIFKNFYTAILWLGFPGGSMVKNLPTSAGDAGSIPDPGRALGNGNCNPFQYSCLGSSMDREVWWATVHGVTKESDMTEWLNEWLFCYRTV